ncbi:MAG: hypothetical protein AAGD11_01725 [Planctomycetota bacterium]
MKQLTHRPALAVLLATQILAAVSHAVEIQPATHMVGNMDPSTADATAVTFAQQPARVGDRVAQTVEVELQLNTSITQAEQQAHESKNGMSRRQQRFVEVLEVVDGNVRRAHVTYPLSRTTSTENDQPADEIVQPVEQRSYFVTREGSSLYVTDADGAIPSRDEFEIIVTSLQNLGRPNPLIKYLVGKFCIGDQLRLSRETAEQLMGLGGQFGRVEEFVLELKSVGEIEGKRCAVFSSSIKAVGEPTNPVRIHAFGQMAIQIDTCRIVSAEISGPMTMSIVEKTPQGDFQYSAQGTMRLAVKSVYGFAQQ